jgi:hypothetical protein
VLTTFYIVITLLSGRTTPGCAIGDAFIAILAVGHRCPPDGS